MKKHLKLKQIFIIYIILMILFLFPKNMVYADDAQESTEEEMHASNLAKFIIEPLGDLINRGINTISGELTENEAAVTLYKTDEINASYKFRSDINVKNEPDNTKTTTDELKKITISNSVYNQYGVLEQIYTTDTKIPVLPLDAYTLTAGKAPILDINFWKLEETNTNKIWNYIKNLVMMIAHIVLYLSVALIFTMIIWRSILFVYSTMVSKPEKAEESKKIIDNLFIAVLMVAGVYILMAGCSMLYDTVLQLITDNNNTYPIRAVVTDVYSFNTTLIGLMRYRTLTNNVWHELGWSIGYLIISFLDLIYFLLMFARMIILGLLSITAPLTAVMKMSGNSEGKGVLQLFQFNNWIKIYLRFTYIPLIIALVSRIMIGLIS
ncbi:MAG TPA: hypothetical protein DEP51_06700 [Clostridiales bacterium]|nr:hypothetical protein [Clostridiales bacterium]